MNKIIKIFYFLETNLFQRSILNSQDFLVVLADHLLNIVKKIPKFRETDNLKHLYRKELDRVCVVYGATYFDREDLTKRIISELIKLLQNCYISRAYEIARN